MLPILMFAKHASEYNLIRKDKLTAKDIFRGLFYYRYPYNMDIPKGYSLIKEVKGKSIYNSDGRLLPEYWIYPIYN